MKPKTTIVLLVLLVLIGLGVWLSKAIRRGAEQRESSLQAGKVFPQAMREAKKLTLESSDGTKLIFVHTNDRWNMIEPKLLPAQGAVIESIVRMMTELTYRRSFPQDAAPSETVTGLTKPRWAVSMTDPSNRTWTLLVGLSAPAVGGEDETYVQAGQQGPVYVVPQDLATILQRDAKDYRDMTALPEVRRDDIVAIRVQGRENYTLQKTDDQWSITQPFTARAEPAAVESLLANLTTQLQAQRILTESAVSTASFGLDQPQLVVTVTVSETATPTATQPAEKTYTLLLGNHRGQGICARVQGKPEVFTLPEAMLDALQPSVDSLRAKTLLAFSPADVDRIEIACEDETLLLQRANDEWTMAKPFAGPTQPGTVDQLLQQLTQLRAESWIAQIRPSGPQWNPQDAIQLHLQDGSVQTLLVGSASSDGRRVCQPVGVNALAVVDASAIDKVLAPAAQYWSRTLLPIPQDAEIQGMTIDRLDGSYVLARCDDAWTLAAPVAGLADAKNMQAILDMLPSLQARRIIALGESLPEAYADAKDRIIVSLTTRSADGKTLQNWKLAVVKIGRNVFAWPLGQPIVAVGVCRQGLYTTLDKPLQKTK